MTVVIEKEYLHDTENAQVITFSRNVFLPLTFVCRNSCGYCTFRKNPEPGCLMAPSDVQASLVSGEKAGCTEALFTFGERPEEVPGFNVFLSRIGYDTILDYCRAMSEHAIIHGLLPHTNAGILSSEEMRMLRPFNASMGLMLETTADIPAHHGCKGKKPEVRIEMIEEAGRQKIPFTTGLLIGIGEGRKDRIESLQVIADLHRRFDHIQEIIIQNFCPKPGTRMAEFPGATLEEVQDTVRLAVEILPGDIAIQIPPNLADASSILPCGVTDLGGVSPVTPDFVNPDHPWPEIDELKNLTKGYQLSERLCIYPKYIKRGWYPQSLHELIKKLDKRISDSVSDNRYQ